MCEVPHGQFPSIIYTDLVIDFSQVVLQRVLRKPELLGGHSIDSSGCYPPDNAQVSRGQPCRTRVSGREPVPVKGNEPSASPSASTVDSVANKQAMQVSFRGTGRHIQFSGYVFISCALQNQVECSVQACHGITACTWLEYADSTPLELTAVTT